MEALRIELRPEDEGDVVFLARLYCDTRRHEVAAWGWPPAQEDMFLTMQFEAQRRGYRQMYPNAVRQIVRVEETDAGRLLVNEESSAIQLIDIALLAEYRNRGIGTRLINELQQECDLRQVALRLHVLAVSPARRLYRRMGLEEVGVNEIYIQMVRNPIPASERVS